MINTLDDYIRRSLPDYGDFHTNPNLSKKVAPDGSFLPYIGNTAVFRLDRSTQDKLRIIQDGLYEQAGGMLAEKLDPSTFHMTLHDLANGTPGEDGLYARMMDSTRRAAEIISRWKWKAPIQMESTWLFNMVNTSIVLGLRPANDASWQALDEMYMELENVTELGYGLCPHITMAYFLPGSYDRSQTEKLSNVLTKVDMRLTLYIEDLLIQTFQDMNNYFSIK